MSTFSLNIKGISFQNGKRGREREREREGIGKNFG
jgi:hypothetical protein